VGALLVRPQTASAIRARFEFPPAMWICLGLWLLFSIYWTLASGESAAARSSESAASRAWHLTLVNVAVLLLVVPVPGLTTRFVPASRYLEIAGLAIQAAFILLAVWARRRLGSNWSGEVRVAAQHQLVQSGPYQVVRHPIYTAVIGMYCGTALVSGQIHAPIATLLVTLAYVRKIRLEERAMAQTFGAEHEAYRSKTWALIPGLY
jgi:protein-S-isoprenylcysteine O-methyltransferase Ste14